MTTTFVQAQKVQIGDLSEGCVALSVGRVGPADNPYVEIVWGNTDGHGEGSATLLYNPTAWVKVTNTSLKEKRDTLAQAIYNEGNEHADFWISTVDGTPNQAAYAIASALIEAGLA
jgi:hypothetical protein